MKAAVIGLGVEGKKAVNSLLNHGWEVYATDLNIAVDLDGLDLPRLSMNMLEGEQTVSIVGENITVDLGFTNPFAIEQCDAIAISPSMYGGPFAERLLMNGELLSDVVTKHREMFTIGITGTNGKTTTVHMLKSILENAGKKVLVGGNGGGGFSGYYDLILEADEGDYDILLVEVCDMTLDFCKNCFDFDYIGLCCSLIVFIFLWLSFRNVWLALSAFIPMLLSWIWIFAIMQLFGLQFNIVNIILATFIFGQGDDYTIFIVEGLLYEHRTGKPMLPQYRQSILLSALIMLIGIGILVIAVHPAMHSLGVVTLIGMSIVLLMAMTIPPLLFRLYTRFQFRKRGNNG